MSVMSVDAFTSRLVAYAVDVLAPSARSGAGRFAIGALAGLAPRMMAGVASSPMARACGLVDEQGNVDVESMKAFVLGGFKASGKLELEIPLGGTLSFGEGDVEGFFQSLTVG